MRFVNDVEKQKMYDIYGELSPIHYTDAVDFYELCEFLNEQEKEKLQYKRQLNTLKYRLRKLIENGEH